MKTWYSENRVVVKGVAVLVVLIVLVALLVALYIKTWARATRAQDEPQAGFILFSRSDQPWKISRLEEVVKQHQLIAISVSADFESSAVIETSKQERILLVLPLSSAKPKGVLLIRYGGRDSRVEYEIGKISSYQLADERPLFKKPVDLTVDVPDLD